MRRALLKITCLFLSGVLSISVFANAPAPVAKKGILDLRKEDLSSKPLTLSGEWAFYWNHLLTPDSIANGTVKPSFVPFPVLWNDLKIDGHSISAQGYATYSLTVYLPARHPRIGLEVPDTYCSYKLYINGVIQAQNGKTATTREDAIPFWVTRPVALPANQPDTMVIVMQVANFWHYRGGTY